MNEQMNAAKRDLDTLMHQMKGYPPRRMAVAVWEWMRAQGFEQAHTPTDDEREATAKAIRLSLRFELGWSADEARTLGAVLAEPVATRLATLRRTAVQEPSAEEVDESAPRYQPCHFDTSGMYVRTWCHAHGYDHLTPDGDVYVQGFNLGDGKTYTGPVSQEDLFGVEPQGEPTDAQALSGLRAMVNAASRQMERDAEWIMRWVEDGESGGVDADALANLRTYVAALTAAYETKGEGR